MGWGKEFGSSENFRRFSIPDTLLPYGDAIPRHRYEHTLRRDLQMGSEKYRYGEG